MKIITLTILLLLSAKSMADYSDDYSVGFVSRVLTDGLNPTTHEPLPTSDWTIKESNVFAGNCQQYIDTSDDHIYNDSDKIGTTAVYLAPETPDCSTATHILDPLDQVDWQDIGLVQKPEFGTEVLTCGYNQSCDLNQTILVQDQIFSTLTPTDGIDGTDSGQAHIFAYDVKSETLSNQRGVGGNAGLSDLPFYSQPTKYCLILRDFDTEGASSAYAKDPLLDLRVITWKPVISNQSGAPGITPSTQQKKIEMHLGLDHLMRFWLEKDNVTVGF